MGKGPVYTDQEQTLLETLAKEGGSPSMLADRFVQELASSRSPTAITQKLRKMMLTAGKGKNGRKAFKKPAKKQTAFVGTRTSTAEIGRPTKKLGRPPKSAAIAATNGYVSNGSHTNGHRDEVTLTLESGLKLVGSKKLVAAALQNGL